MPSLVRQGEAGGVAPSDTSLLTGLGDESKYGASADQRNGPLLGRLKLMRQQDRISPARGVDVAIAEFLPR